MKRVPESLERRDDRARGTVLHALDREIRDGSGGRAASTTSSARSSKRRPAISLVHFRAVSERIAGASLANFFDQSALEPPD